MPVDGATREVIIKNSYISLVDNPNDDRYVGVYFEYQEGSDRNEIVVYKNNTHENIDNLYPILD